MNDLQFFPTPLSLARSMAYMIPSEAISILEPSAGTGNIVTAIKSRFESRYGTCGKKIYACEISKSRQLKLNEMEIPIIGEDFLSFEPKGYSFDCIIMNPPFNKGIEHFNQAYSMLNEGGTIICLLNSSSLHDGNNKKKAFVKLLNDNEAEYTMHEGAFIEAEVRTNVSCVLIKMKKPKSEAKYDFFTKALDEELGNEEGKVERYDEQESPNGLMKYNYITSMVAKYNKTREKYNELLIAHKTVQFFLPTSLPNTREKQIFPTLVPYNEFIDELRSECWNEIFRKTKIANFLTGTMKEEFFKLQNGSSMKEFNVENINSMLMILVNNKKAIMEKSVEELFDMMTKHYSENQMLIEGWKTNSHYKVNKKIILPWALESDYGGGYNFTYTFRDKIADIEKTLCLMMGLRLEDVVKKWVKEGITDEKWCQGTSIELACQEDNSRSLRATGKWYESEFFNIKFYKKGTMHFEFKSEKVWELFNIIACKSKNWIG
jgi:hypothetical protein